MTRRDEHDVADADPILARALEVELLAKYGLMVGNDDLRVALGYPSHEAFRQANSRGQLPIRVFTLPNRRGKFALVKDVAYWVAQCHANAAPLGGTLPGTQGEGDDLAPRR